MPSADRDHREAVIRAYARALGRGASEEPAARSGWSPYGWTELALLPPAALGNSFGCGNPLRHADLREGERVLDLGCGAGLDLLLAARRVGTEGLVAGVDLTPAMASAARAAAAAAGLANVGVVEGRMEDLPFADASFDWVVSNGAVSLSLDKPRVFRELRRVARATGGVVLADLAFDERPHGLGDQAALADSSLAGALAEDDWAPSLCAAGLTDVAVVERRAWSVEEVHAILRAEIDGAARGGADDAAAVLAAAEDVAGHLLSVTFRARRAR
jgi:SAM-dependent methyltransferase